MRRILSLAALSAALLAAETPSLTLLVGNKDENSLAFVDPASGKVLGRVPTGEGPHEVVASTDGKLAFVANYGTGAAPGSTLSVIDAVNMKEIRKVDISPLRRPHGLWFANGKCYFTAEANRTVGSYDPATNKVDMVVGTGQNTSHMIIVSQDNTIFTANIGSDTISIIDRAGATAVPVGKGPEAMDLSPDGKELWTGHSRDGGVSVIDVASKKVVATIPLGTKRSNRLKFTRDGKRVLISDLDAGEIVVLDAATRKATHHIPMGKAPEGILMAKDGSKAYVAVAGDSNIAILDLATLKVTGHLETGRGPDGMAWADRR
ncbi:MAG TPA: cytochrome D1 domain-containing protein [Candidatus Solibacter sp.]|nr:cytochrome D1 domain-containing protein [Candidatus Solibacter sp.]